jgi:hypothetical protein
MPKREATHVAQQEEEALMMVIVTITSHSFATAAAARDGEGGDAACSRIQGPVSSLVEQRWRLVYLHVERIFVQLGPKEEPPPPKVWISDTGATNHMSGS